MLKSACVRFEQPENTPEPRLVTLAGKSIDGILVLANAELPTLSRTLLSSVTFESDEQELNALLPIEVTCEGMTMLEIYVP